jgi:hypothetical protein
VFPEPSGYIVWQKLKMIEKTVRWLEFVLMGIMKKASSITVQLLI